MSTHTQLLQRWIAVLLAAIGILATLMMYQLWRDSQTALQLPPGTADAATIRIEREGSDDITLARNGASWFIETPCELSANEQRLEPLLGALTPGVHQYEASDVDLQAAGLVSPLATVTINETAYRIGNTDLSGERRYVQRGNQVAFVPEWVLSLVNGGVTALADLAVFADPLEQLTLTDDQGSEIVLSTADQLRPWQDLSAQQIITWPPEDTALPQPSLQISASATNGDSLLYTVYNTEKFTALTLAGKTLSGKSCAYILPLDTLPN